ncbi:MAG: GNAT family protein [Microbacteriaceae bacterium]
MTDNQQTVLVGDRDGEPPITKVVTVQLTADPDADISPDNGAHLPYDAVLLKADRLVLRPLIEAELLDADAARDNNQEEIERYLLWEVRDRDQTAKSLAKHRAMKRLKKDKDGLVYAVEFPDPAGGPGRSVGKISLQVKSAVDGQFEVGWVFHPAAHGRGFATEAARAVLGLCFDTLGAHRVRAELDPRNEASARLCGILGMRKEAHFVDDQFFQGEWTDTVIYAILADEWRQRQFPPAE